MKEHAIKNHTEGFIALMSAIIISAILMGFLFIANRMNFYARFDTLDREDKAEARNMAESCINETLVRLAKDYNYDISVDPSYTQESGIPIRLGDGMCYITSISPPRTQDDHTADLTITTRGIYKDTFSRFKAEATMVNPEMNPTTIPRPPNITIKSWAEISGP